jgi:hypothetical protein
MEGMHIFFVPLTQGVTQSSCTCGLCSGEFRCEFWRYKELVPHFDALSLTMEALLERTNPVLKEQPGWSTRVEELGADPRFKAAIRSLDEFREGPLSKRLRDELRRWDELDEGQREALVYTIDQSARVLRFAQSMAPRVPSAAGCIATPLACLAVWTAFLWLPQLGLGALWQGVGVAFAGLAAGGAVHQLLLERRVSRWIHEVLVPEGQEAGIDFHHFIAFLDDLPTPGPRSDDVLRQWGEQSRMIRNELSAFDVKLSNKFTCETDSF